MVAIEIEEDFIFDDLGDATFVDKLVFDTEVALFEVGEIKIDDEFDLVIHLMFEDALDGRIIQFCHLDDGMSYFTALAIPIGDEILGFVHVPFVEIVVKLDPVFAIFGSHTLAESQ